MQNILEYPEIIWNNHNEPRGKNDIKIEFKKYTFSNFYYTNT